MNESKFQIKQIICAILATASFVAIVLCCMQLKSKGIPVLLCLILHTCSLLLLYKDALMAADPEDWEDEDEWMEEDLPPSETEVPPAPSHQPEAAETPVYSEKEETREDEKEELLEGSDVPLRYIYAEVRESLIDAPAHVQEMVEEIADEISAETILPAPEEGTIAAAVIPNALHTFLARPKDIVEMDLIAAAKDAMESLQTFAERQHIKLNLSTTCETLMMKADPDSIRILFRNIIDNSIKYMGRPGHMIITISLLGDDIFLILKDTGMGLSEAETEHVFELNFQGSNRVSGNGLGLTQTKMIVEAFGGTIYAKSSPGNGMAIYIQLPVSGSAPQ